MQYENKLAKLILAIYRKTTSGELRWESHPTLSEVYKSTLKDSSLEISYVREFESTDMEVRVYNEFGRLVESIRDTTLSSVSVGIPGYSGWFSLMVDIYETAKRQSNGSEKVIDNILSELDDDIPF